MRYLNEDSEPRALAGRVDELEAALRILLRAAEKAGVVSVYLRRSEDRGTEGELASAIRWAFNTVGIELPKRLR